jgi:hypothetical protein
MHPYRDMFDPPKPSKAPGDVVLVHAVVLFVLGTSRALVAVVTHERVGFEVIVATVLVVGASLAIRTRRSHRGLVERRGCSGAVVGVEFVG